jgi:hypothetical protein
MSKALSRVGIAITIAVTLPSAILAQEHQPATPAVKATPKQTVGVTSTATPTQVAAAIAEALRTAEALQAKRQTAVPRPAPPRRPAEGALSQRYEVKWPEEHTAVRWPTPRSDRVHVAWPVAATGSLDGEQ